METTLMGYTGIRFMLQGCSPIAKAAAGLSRVPDPG